MTAEEAIEIAKSCQEWEDHSFHAVFCPAGGLLDNADDCWDVWVTYNPVKGLMTPDSCVVVVNARTREAKLIRLA